MQGTALPVLGFLVFLASPASGQSGGAWRVYDGEKPVGVYGFSLSPDPGGYKFLSGRTFTDPPGEPSWERLELQTDSKLRILSLGYEAVQGGVRVRVSGKQEGEVLRVELREGRLPAHAKTFSPDTCAAELPLFRHLLSGKPGETETFRAFEPITMRLFYQRVESEKGGGGAYRLSLHGASAPGQEEVWRFRCLRDDPSSLQASFSACEEGSGLQYRPVAFSEWARDLSALAAKASPTDGPPAGIALEVARILEKAAASEEAEHKKLVDRLAALGPGIAAVISSYRGENLEPVQKILLGLALSRLGPEAETAFVEWMEGVGSYERILIVRGLGNGQGTHEVPLLFGLLAKASLGLERETTKVLLGFHTRLGGEPLRGALLPRLPGPSSLYRFANAAKIPLLAKLWRAGLAAASEPEKAALLSLIGRQSLDGPQEARDDLVEEVSRLFLDGRKLPIRAEAAGALGRLRSYESIPLLVEALDEEGLAERALESLKLISGLQFAQTGRWKAWWEEEQSRFESELPKVLAKLEDERKEHRLAAIADLPRFTLGRDEIQLALVHRLADPEEEVRTAAKRLLEGWSE